MVDWQIPAVDLPNAAVKPPARAVTTLTSVFVSVLSASRP